LPQQYQTQSHQTINVCLSAPSPSFYFYFLLTVHTHSQCLSVRN
jgi:hypothetical protein